VIRLRDSLGLVQFLSTTVPRLAAEMPRIAAIHLRDEITVEYFPLKGRGDAVAALRGSCRMRVIACGQAELLPYQCGPLGLPLNRFHEILPWPTAARSGGGSI
jgi:hypothetical protein